MPKKKGKTPKNVGRSRFFSDEMTKSKERSDPHEHSYSSERCGVCSKTSCQTPVESADNCSCDLSSQHGEVNKKEFCGHGSMESMEDDGHHHSEDCGHTAIKHGDHYGFLVDGHLHCVLDPAKSHEVVCHALAVTNANPTGCVPLDSDPVAAEEAAVGWHEPGHVHGPGCGHERVPHGDHFDYLVGNTLHHQHGGHCDHHGVIMLHELRKVQRKPAVRYVPERKSAEFEEEEEETEHHDKGLIAKRRRHIEEDHSIKDLLKKGVTSQRRFSLMLILTGGYFLVELIFGLKYDSLALLSDSFHMLSDFAALIIGYAAARLSTRMKDHKMSYGWQRAEVVGALTNACFLVAVCFTIILEAAQKLAGYGHSEHESLNENAVVVLIVGGVGLGINILGLIIFGGHGHSHGGGHSHRGEASHKPKKADANKAEKHEVVALALTDACDHAHEGNGHEDDAHSHAHDHTHEHGKGGAFGGEHDFGAEGDQEERTHSHGHTKGGQAAQEHRHSMNMNEHGMYLHVLGDALGSVAVMVSGAIIQYSDDPKRWLADPLCSLVIVAIILYGTLPLLRDSAMILLETAPARISEDVADLDDLEGLIEQVEGVIEVHEVHLWRLTQDTLVCSLHVVVDKATSPDVMVILDRIKIVLHAAGIHSSTIQPEYMLPSEIQQLSLNPSNCADLVCESSSCLMNSCCRLTRRPEPLRRASSTLEIPDADTHDETYVVYGSPAHPTSGNAGASVYV